MLDFFNRLSTCDFGNFDVYAIHHTKKQDEPPQKQKGCDRINGHTLACNPKSCVYIFQVLNLHIVFKYLRGYKYQQFRFVTDI